MIIYIPKEFEAHLHVDKTRIHVIPMTREDLQTFFPYWERLTAIRTSKLWNEQAVMTGWLSNAPQARLAEYNPLVMSKLLLLRDAARLNPWGARYHMWMDAGHLCATEQNPTPAGTSFYRSHMANGMFVTHWPYATNTEVHGLADKAMHIYLAQPQDPLRIVRGGIFGGQLPHIECVLRAYILALHQTLTDGYVGTEVGTATIVPDDDDTQHLGASRLAPVPAWLPLHVSCRSISDTFRFFSPFKRRSASGP